MGGDWGARYGKRRLQVGKPYREASIDYYYTTPTQTGQWRVNAAQRWALAVSAVLPVPLVYSLSPCFIQRSPRLRK